MGEQMKPEEIRSAIEHMSASGKLSKELERLFISVHTHLGRIAELEAENEQLSQQICDECSPDDYGWNYNAVEGRVPCVCIIESGAYQELEAERDQLCADLSGQTDRAVQAEAKLDRVRGIGQVHDSWGASKEFKDGWRECLEQVQSALGDEDE